METGKLVITTEGKPDSAVELGERLTIGRSMTNELVLDDQKASRSHAEIRHLGGGRYRMSDLGSANGTWINGRRLTVPRELENGDQIIIGGTLLHYVAPPVIERHDNAAGTGTALYMRSENVVVLVADIRNFTGMSEALPNREFSKFISGWFRETSDIVEEHQGCIDKFIGDAVMAYWISSPGKEGAEVNAALETATRLLERAAIFSERISAVFPGNSFRIGVGLNRGNAMLGNVGTVENQSFTIVGDSVNVAFRLEALTKEKGAGIVVSSTITEAAGPQFQFRPLGLAEVKGRKEPVRVFALECVPPIPGL